MIKFTSVSRPPRLRWLTPTLSLLLCLAAIADDNTMRVQSAYQENLEQWGDNPAYRVRPGLLACRTNHWIEIQGEAIGLNPHDPIEFFLIGQSSAHDYEALIRSYAEPQDIYEALQFIGVPPGRPVNYEKYHLWPRGERVFLDVSWQTVGTSNQPAIARVDPIEHFLVDTRTGTPLPRKGFCFVGSTWLDNPENTNQQVLAAQHFDPHAIVSDYNEPTTLLDVPHKMIQGEVYRFQRINPDLMLPYDQLVTVRLTPEYTDGKTRVRDLRLVARPNPDSPSILLDLVDSEGASIANGSALKHILAVFNTLRENGQTPFVKLDPAPEMTVQNLQDLYSLLATLTTENGIRIEPPDPDDLFYRAFLPPARFRNRAGRPSQPAELHLSHTGTGLQATLTVIDEEWPPDANQPTLSAQDYPIAGPFSLSKALSEYAPDMPVLLVFTEPDTTYGTLCDFLRPIRKTHDTIYIFGVSP